MLHACSKKKTLLNINKNVIIKCNSKTKMKHIAFINPPNAPFTSRGILIEPIDTLGLASWVEHLGYETSILDMDVKQLEPQDLKEVYKNNWPSVMIVVFDYHIPLHDVGANKVIKEICELARENGSITILGGKAATFLERDKLKENIVADFYLRFEMEETLKELLFAIKSGEKDYSKIKGLTYWNSCRDKLLDTEERQEKIDIKDLPISNRNLVDLNDYIDVRTVLSSRGCNLQCTFCHVPGFWGLWRGRTPEQVVKEMQILKNQHNAKKILLLDDNAFAQPKRLEKVALGLKESNTDIAWGCLGTIDRYNQKSLEVMASGGFKWIHFGAESGDDEQLSTMGKKITNSKILEAVRGTRELGIRVRTSWILDMPGLTLDGLKKTEDLIVSQGSEEIRLHFLTLRLGSILDKQFKIEAPQFIHNGKQNLNLSSVSSEDIEQSVNRILKELIKQGYKVVKTAKDFENVDKLKENNPSLKIVSLCPLRYGLNWI